MLDAEDAGFPTSKEGSRYLLSGSKLYSLGGVELCVFRTQLKTYWEINQGSDLIAMLGIRMEMNTDMQQVIDKSITKAILIDAQQ